MSVTRDCLRIIGIDPGLRTTGWGIVDFSGNNLIFVDCGAVCSDARRSLGERLAQLHFGLAEVIDKYKPEEAAIEETFVNKDPQSALLLGQARGIALVVPALANIKISEYAANLVKKTVTGTGHANKDQIKLMVGMLLPKAKYQKNDTADALAVAITHSSYRRFTKLSSL